MILDGRAPTYGTGRQPPRNWYRDVLVEGEQHGASGYVATLGESRHVTVTGDNAYVVVPASMTYKVHDK